MRELSLHILDLVQNSIEAGATTVILEIMEDTRDDQLVIRISDNGRGMEPAILDQVTDPFVTTRTTRKVGLGLPLIDMSTKRCEGELTIRSVAGEGTVVEARYRHGHWDRPPLGDMVETLKSIIIANPSLDFRYSHSFNDAVFRLETVEITGILGDIPLTHPEVLEWLDGYLRSNYANLYGGVPYENS